MADIKIPPRRINTPQKMWNTQTDKLKVKFESVSEKQSELKKGIEDVIGEIFKSYKENGFKNDKNLKLIKAYFLLRNITKNNQDFVGVVKDKNEQIQEQIDNIINSLSESGGIGKEITDDIKKSLDKEHVSSDIKEIFKKTISQFFSETNSQKQNDTNGSDGKETILRARNAFESISGDSIDKKLDEMTKKGEFHSLTKDNVSTFTTKLFGGLITAFSRYEPKRGSTENLEETETKKDFSDNGNKDYSKSKDNLKIDTGKKQSNKSKPKKEDKKKRRGIFDKMCRSLSDVARASGKKINKNLNNVNLRLGRISLGLSISNGASGILGLGKMFKSGKASPGGVFKAVGMTAIRGSFMLFNIGAFIVKGVLGIGKFVLKSVIGFAKGIAKFTFNVVKSVMKSISKPLLSGLMVALRNPAVAFGLGYIAHMFTSKITRVFKSLKSKLDDNPQFQEIKKFFKENYDQLKKKFKDSKTSSVKDIVDKWADLASKGKLFDYISDIVQLFTKNKVGSLITGAVMSWGMWKVGGWLLKKSLGALWRNRNMIVRGAGHVANALTGAIGGTGLLAVGAATFLIGGFYCLIKQANEILPKFQEAKDRYQSGDNRKRYSQRQSFQAVNARFREYKKMTLFKLDEGQNTSLRRSGVKEETIRVIQESFQDYGKQRQEEASYQRIVERSKKEGAPLDREYAFIRKALGEIQDGREETINDAISTLDIVYKDGDKVKKTNDVATLCVSKGEFLKFRTIYMLIRSELVKKLSNGDITEEQYDQMVSDIIVKNGDQFQINEKFTGSDFIKFKKASDKLSEQSSKTAFSNHVWYEERDASYQEASSNNAQSLIQTLNYTFTVQQEGSYSKAEKVVEHSNSKSARQIISAGERAQKLFGWFCGVDVTKEFASLQSPRMVYSLIMQLLRVEQVKKYLRAFFSRAYEAGSQNRIPDFNKLDQKTDKKFREYFEILSRNEKFAEGFYAIISRRFIFDEWRFVLVDDIQGQGNEFFIATSQYTWGSGYPYQKKVIPKSLMARLENVPRLSRFSSADGVSQSDFIYSERIERIDVDSKRENAIAQRSYNIFPKFGMRLDGQAYKPAVCRFCDELQKKIDNNPYDNICSELGGYIDANAELRRGDTKCVLVNRANDHFYIYKWANSTSYHYNFAMSFDYTWNIDVTTAYIHRFEVLSQEEQENKRKYIAADFARFLYEYLRGFEFIADEDRKQEALDLQIGAKQRYYNLEKQAWESRYFIGEDNGGWVDEQRYKQFLEEQRKKSEESNAQQNNGSQQERQNESDTIKSLEEDQKVLEQQTQTLMATRQIIDSRIGAKQNNGQNGNSVGQNQQTTVMSVGDNSKLTEAEIAARKKQNSK